jgi:hypothetical protein
MRDDDFTTRLTLGVEEVPDPGPVPTPPQVSPGFRDKMKRLPEGGRTARRFRTRVAEFEALLSTGQYRPYAMSAAGLVAGELAKLGECDRDLAARRCAEAGDRMFSLAIEITLARLGILKAAGAGEGGERDA